MEVELYNGNTPKPANILRSMVLHHKDKTPKEHWCGTIYNITCDIDSSHTYIEKLSQRFKEYTNLDKSTSVGDQYCPVIPTGTR